MEIKDLKQDSRNYRKHNDKNISLIRKSVDECGIGRSVVIDKNNEIIAGNGLISAVSKNTPIKVIETTGDELVVVKRTDLDTNDEKRKKLAVLDNSTTDNSEFNIGLLQEDFSAPELEDLGVEIENIDVEEEEDNGQMPTGKKLLKCPACGHINEEKAFKTYLGEDEDTD